jgi:hypothetical protein
VVSEFIDGPSLQERVDASGPLAEGELLRLAVGTATALTAIHGAGVVHRDFKPANVLLGPDGPRVVDFGIARLTDAATITSGVIGTPSYMAPEQLAGSHPTGAVDIFAWAVTLVYAATGRTAFGADTVAAVMHRILTAEPDLGGVPSSLLPLLGQCLSKDPLQRPTARDALLAIVDPTARQSSPAGFDHPATIGVAGSQPVPVSPMPVGPVHTSPVHTGPVPPPYASPPMEVVTDPRGPSGLPTNVMAAPRFRRGPILAAVGAAALAAGIAVGAVLLINGPASPNPGVGPRNSSSANVVDTGTSQPTAAATATTASSAPAASGPVIPAGFAGTWSGTAKQSMLGNTQVRLPNSITLTLPAGGRTAHEVDQECVNTLTLTTVTDAVLTFDEPDVPGTCVGGTVTLTRNGNALTYRWTDGIEQNVGDLRKGG